MAGADDEAVRSTERRRLAALVDFDAVTADELHHDEFLLTTPSGGVWTKDVYLGGIASGRITYRRFEAVSAIDVVLGGDLAVLRYRSAIDIAVEGARPGPLTCWHLDVYRRDGPTAAWRVQWSQATEIARG